MSWASDKARELVPPDAECGAGDCQCKRARERSSVERAIRETLARVRSEVAEASRDLPQETRLALDAALRRLGEP